MTYAEFLLLFVVVPIGVLSGWLGIRGQLDRRLILAIGATSIVAVCYTTPWDNLLLAQAVWSYPVGRVLGPTLGLVPLEEYAFFVLQVFLIGLLTRAMSSPDRSEVGLARVEVRDRPGTAPNHAPNTLGDHERR